MTAERIIGKHADLWCYTLEEVVEVEEKEDKSEEGALWGLLSQGCEVILADPQQHCLESVVLKAVDPGVKHVCDPVLAVVDPILNLHTGSICHVFALISPSVWVFF